MLKQIKMVSVCVLLSCLLASCSHSTANDSELDGKSIVGETLLGEVSAEKLFAQYPAFQAEYKAYKPSKQELAAVAELEKDTLLVLFGTWCHDSQREVPRLLKTFDLSGLDVPKLTLVAVDTKKTDPQGIAQKYNLKYTPTFILLHDDKELGRVVERPKTSLTQDLKALAKATQ